MAKKTAKRAVKKAVKKAAKKSAPKTSRKAVKKKTPEKPTKKAPKKRSEGSDRPLTASELKDIKLSIARGYKQLKLKPGQTSSEKAQDSIADVMVDVIEGKKKPSQRTVEDMGINLGCLWGQTICDELGWEWCYATVRGDEFFAVVSPNRSYALAPMNFIFTQLHKRVPDENNSMLLYNMLIGRTLPKTKAGEYVTIA